MSEETSRRLFGWVLLAFVVLLFLRLGAHPLLDPDEARFARTSVEMMRDGDLVVPTFQGKPRLAKPPMLHWIQSALFRATGPGPWPARLPPAFATLGAILLAAFVARRRMGGEAAVWAVAVLASMPLVFALGRIGTLDALLAVHVFAVVAIDLATPQVRSIPRALAIGALLGLAFLVKGPVGVIVPLLIVLVGRTAAGREIVPDWRGVAVAGAGWAAVVAPWGVALLRRLGAESVAGLLREEVFARYVGGTVHVRPPWFFVVVFAVGFLPWAGPAAVAVVRAMVRLRDPAYRTTRYLAAGLVAGLVFFSIGKGKLPSYVLPLAPLAALLATSEIGHELARRRERGIGGGFVAATMIAFAIALGGVAWIGSDPSATAFVRVAAVVVAVAAALAFAGYALRRPRLVYGAAAGGMAAFYVAAIFLMLPAMGRERSAAALVRAAPALAEPRPVVVVARELPSLTFYADRIPEKVEVDALAERVARGDGAIFVIDDADYPRIGADLRARMRPIAREGRFRLLESEGEANVPGEIP